MTEIKMFTNEIRQALRSGSLLTQTALYARGWTKKEIAEYLPEPELYKNPVYQSREPMKVWEADGIEDIERSMQLGLYKR